MSDTMRELKDTEMENVSGGLAEAFDWVAASLVKVVVCGPIDEPCSTSWTWINY